MTARIVATRAIGRTKGCCPYRDLFADVGQQTMVFRPHPLNVRRFTLEHFSHELSVQVFALSRAAPAAGRGSGLCVHNRARRTGKSRSGARGKRCRSRCVGLLLALPWRLGAACATPVCWGLAALVAEAGFSCERWFVTEAALRAGAEGLLAESRLTAKAAFA